MNQQNALLFAPDRSPRDRSQDGPRRAADTITVGGLSAGQNILELEPGKGWFTNILLRLTAKSGSLTVQQPAALNAFFGKDARQRVADSGHARARYSDASWEKLAPKDSSIDRVVWLQGPHELWFKPSPGKSFGEPSLVFAEIARVLKPGGCLLVVDNLAPSGVTLHQAGSLHRSVPRLLREKLEDAGLVLKEQVEDWITNQHDPLTVPTYDPTVHLRTRQFLQVFYKPT